MNGAIAVRVKAELLEKIDELSREDSEDRSTMIRKLIVSGYKELLKEKASKLYMEGRITLSEAANRAGLTLMEMEHYLVDRGFKSQYSIDDLEREMSLLK